MNWKKELIEGDQSGVSIFFELISPDWIFHLLNSSDCFNNLYIRYSWTKTSTFPKNFRLGFM